MNARLFTVVAIASAIGCGFAAMGDEVAGLGPTAGSMQAAEGGSDGPDSGEDDSDSDGSAGDSGGNDGVGSVTSPDSDDGSDTMPGEAGEESDGGESGDVDVCAEQSFYKEVVDAEDALLIAPMTLWTLPGEETFVATLEDDAGVASFLWTAPCDGTYRLWVRVWDIEPGALGEDPDSFDVALVEGTSSTWNYGCQTATTFSPAWHWLRVQTSLGCVFEENAIDYVVGAGPHVFRFGGLEGGTFNGADPPGELAAISRILVTNDLSYVPGTDD